MTAEIVVAATGNGMKSHPGYDTFLEVSGGFGNRTDSEVHLLMRSNDGEFCEGWFAVAELLAAVESARTEGAATNVR